MRVEGYKNNSGGEHARSRFRRPRHRDRSRQARGLRHLVFARTSAGRHEIVRALKAWRYWSDTDPSLHHAMYQFADKAALQRATEGSEMKRLVADFNRDWPDVTRTREVLVLAEELVA